MTTPDLDVIKEIPGYKVILKAVLKSQIQQLVEQLAATTDEESVILTASVSDGTLSHLGSDSGKNFLEDHEDFKSQFLGFCLKRHHRRKQEEEREKAQQEQERQQRESLRQMSTNFPGVYGPPGVQSPPRMHQRFPRQQFRLPQARHQPYPVTRPFRAGHPPTPPHPPRPDLNTVIKIEHEDSNESDSVQEKTGSNIQTSEDSAGSPQSTTAASPAKNRQTDGEEDVKSEGSANPSEEKFGETQPPGGLSLDSDFSILLNQESSQSDTTASAVADPLKVKVEAISEADMELEITGVEPGHLQTHDNSGWSPNVSVGDMSYDGSGGASGSQADMMPGDQGYNTNFMGLDSPRHLRQQQQLGFSVEEMLGTSRQSDDPTKERNRGGKECPICGRMFRDMWFMNNHMRTHTGEKPFICSVCNKGFKEKAAVRKHMVVHANMSIS